MPCRSVGPSTAVSSEACVDTISTPTTAARSSAPTSASAPEIPAPSAPAPAADAAAAPQRVPRAYAPTEYFFLERRLPSSGRAWSSARLAIRLNRDPQLLLAVAIALPVLAVEGSAQTALPWLTVALPLGFAGLQVMLTALRTQPSWLPTARLALSLAFVVLVNAWLDPTGRWPLNALAIPVVALAAARGGRGPAAVSIVGMGIMLVPMAFPGADPLSRQETLALAMAAVVVALGSRRVVANLERSTLRLRQANHRDRRHARQLAAVESVGRLLAREGPTATTLDNVMGVLEGTFGYRYPSVYVWDGSVLHLGAQRNYAKPIHRITPDRGILGRVVRTREAVFLPDARSDPDFLAADPGIVSEISIPLVTDGELFGVLNVETSGEHRLDPDDFATMQIVGDRLAAALALGRERQKLTERAALLDRLTHFATALGSSLDKSTMDEQLATGAAEVIPADTVVVINLEEDSGAYVIDGVAGGDRGIIGRVIRAGEGASGRAIKERRAVVEDHLDRDRFPKAVAEVKLPDTLAAMAAPMLIDDQVTGVVTWLRGDLDKPFTAQEQEIAGLLAGRAGLAIANARLHQKTRDAAITDPLTGIHNRRHFDTVIDREDAIRRRIPGERRRLRSAILFDLDHFGRVNKRYGHQVGDRVLKLFADILRERARKSDLVARYGGEEFVVILDNAGREDAGRIAEDVRAEMARHTVDTGTGEQLTTTVSAGCSTLEQWEVEGSLLLERADVALAMAKAGGRDQIVSA
jgi:diguanylate cyclase (GGDEF)-like protein